MNKRQRTGPWNQVCSEGTKTEDLQRNRVSTPETTQFVGVQEHCTKGDDPGCLSNVGLGIWGMPAFCAALNAEDTQHLWLQEII